MVDMRVMRINVTMMAVVDVVRRHVMSVMFRLVVFRVLHMTTMRVVLGVTVMTRVTGRVVGLEVAVMAVVSMLRHLSSPD